MWDPTPDKPVMEPEQFRVNPADLPRQLIPFAKLGPKGLPQLLAANLTDLGTLASILNGFTSDRSGDGEPFHGFYDSPSVPQPGPYTTANHTPTRTLDAATATLADVANFLCTLVDDLKSTGLLG